MSWSVNRTGLATEVKTEIAADLARQVCAEPEETVKNSAAQTIKTALEAQAEGVRVRVSAYGSQSVIYDGTGAHVGVKNTLHIEIAPE